VREGQKLADEFFARRKRTENADHLIVATGHCHIDTAWLWPYDETKRKSARSWATQCTWMDMYPDFVFSCSQAQQMEWTEQNYPLLFKRIKNKVEKGQFVPIGGVSSSNQRRVLYYSKCEHSFLRLFTRHGVRSNEEVLFYSHN
jgi:alpha-mannosidase